MKIFLRVLFFVCIVASLPQAQADEKKELIGQLSISDILIQPRFISTESSTTHFDLDRSYFFFSWNMDKMLSAHFGVGQMGLINHNARLASNLTNTSKYSDLAFFEAYGQLDSKYGVLRAGLVPLMFGWEGGRRESDWIFPRTLFFGGEDSTYRTQNFGLRDQGVSYNVSYKNFYTYATIHNGENGADIDGKIWHTGRIGWKTPGGVEIATSFSNGKYQNGKSNPVEKYTYGNLFGTFEFYNLMVLLEGLYGRQQILDMPSSSTTADDIKFWDMHLDLSHPLTKNLTGLFRYEIYEPDSTVDSDKTSRYILGVEISNELRTSNLYVWAIKNQEQGHDVANNQFMVLWKVRSLSIF